MAPQRDADEEFREIKREIIESRGLVIKTHNATNALAADVKAVARRQAAYERRLSVNSAVSYVLFTALTFGGLKLWLDASVRERTSENHAIQQQLDRSRTEIAGLQRERDERTQLETRTLAFYDLVREGKRQEAVEAWASLRRDRLPAAEAAFFQDTVDRFRTDLSISAYERGLEHARLARYVQANEAFDEAIRLREDASHIPRVKLAQGDSLRHLGRHREAIVVLQTVAESADSEVADDAMYLVARCQQDLNLYGEARTTLRALIRRFPYGSITAEARQTLVNLQLPDGVRRGR
ncbi:MAG: tetratricopeptide repeat protein [Deltaproteobacteria bacterium]|nr:tetratricopeptide repeat protein [Deltaproteobacteria bacterium]